MLDIEFESRVQGVGTRQSVEAARFGGGGAEVTSGMGHSYAFFRLRSTLAVCIFRRQRRSKEDIKMFPTAMYSYVCCRQID